MIDATFLHLDDFLTAPEQTELRRFVRDHEADLVTSTVNPAGETHYEVDDDFRQSRVLYASSLSVKLPHSRQHTPTKRTPTQGLAVLNTPIPHPIFQ